MDSETEQQLYAYDLEDGQPPIMLDSESWQALRAYADAKGAGPCGKGWVGTKPNCKRSKDVNSQGLKAANEGGALSRLGSSKLSAGNAARLAHLRKKMGTTGIAAGNQFNAQFEDKRSGSRIVPYLASVKAAHKANGLEFKARNQAKGKAKQEAKRFGTALPEEADLVSKAMAANEKKLKNASTAEKRMATRAKNKAAKAS